MAWFKNLKIRVKLALGFICMILFLGIIGLAGYLSTRNIWHYLDEIYAVRLPGVENLLEFDRNLNRCLVAERSILFVDVRSDFFKTLSKDYDDNLRNAQENLNRYKALPLSSEEGALLSQVEQAWEEWQDISKQAVEARRRDTREGRREALDLTLGVGQEKFVKLEDSLAKLTQLNLMMAEAGHREAQGIYRYTSHTLLGVIGAGLLVGLALMWILGRGINKPLHRAIRDLTAASDQVAVAANQVASSSQFLAQGSSQQAASLEETSASLEEMASMTRTNADNASQAKALMKKSDQVVGDADQAMGDLTASMAEVSTASQETAKIIKTIDEIAFQTNMLALNAAVEAARAGEAGAGFAVVADEVRALAMRAAEAAKNTASLIEGTVNKVKEGTQQVDKAAQAFSQVAETTGKVKDLVEEIAAASSEQAQGVEQVNKAVNEMNQVTQQVAANAEESASASEEMSAQSKQMKGVVGELVVLVVGSHNGRVGRTRRLGHQTLPAASRQAVGLPSRKGKALPAPTRAGPEQVIPFDDEGDSKDF